MTANGYIVGGSGNVTQSGKLPSRNGTEKKSSALFNSVQIQCLYPYFIDTPKGSVHLSPIPRYLSDT